MLAPARNATLATAGFIVSMEIIIGQGFSLSPPQGERGPMFLDLLSGLSLLDFPLPFPRGEGQGEGSVSSPVLPLSLARSLHANCSITGITRLISSASLTGV